MILESPFCCLSKISTSIFYLNFIIFFKVIRLHDLRHTSATILLNNGNLDIKRIQNWLGHSSYNTTANIYTHLDKSANVVTGDVVNNLLKL